MTEEGAKGEGAMAVEESSEAAKGMGPGSNAVESAREEGSSAKGVEVRKSLREVVAVLSACLVVALSLVQLERDAS